MLFGVFVPPSFPFTFDDSAESERVERARVGPEREHGRPEEFTDVVERTCISG